MNTNLIHNVLNIAITVTAGLAAFDWSAILAPTTAAKIVGALAFAKLVINALRDGFAGMVKEQPPVK
jgi:hypothetical protein